MVAEENVVLSLSCLVTPVFLLATGGGLAWSGVFLIEAFECFSQTDPSCLKGVPLSDQQFVFNVSLDAAHDVAES